MASTQPSDAPQHFTSQVGASAIAPPTGLDALPPLAPALHHLKADQTTTTQLGPSAVAPPSSKPSTPPPPPPAPYHHLKDADFPASGTGGSPVSSTRPSAAPSRASSPTRKEVGSGQQTISTQLGPNAVAPPVDVPMDLPTPAPALHHLEAEAKQTAETQVGPNAIAPPAVDVVNPWEAAQKQH